MFVLTHYARAPIEMEGGTVFHFVTDGIEAALDQAQAVAGDLDVKIGGGVSTVRQYLQAGLIDELHFAIAPVVLGRGEAIFDGIDLPGLGFRGDRARRDRARDARGAELDPDEPPFSRLPDTSPGCSRCGRAPRSQGLDDLSKVSSLGFRIEIQCCLAYTGWGNKQSRAA